MAFEFKCNYNKCSKWASSTCEMYARGSFAGLALSKAEDSREIVVAVDICLAEAAAVAFQQLLLLCFNEVELYVAVYSLATIWGAYTEECAPLLVWLQCITNDLYAICVSKWARPVKRSVS